MTVLLLTENDVRCLLTMDIALEAVEEGLRRLALDEAQNVPRTRAQTGHVILHVLSAAAKALGVVGYKAYTTSRTGTQFHVALMDGKTGALLSLMHADFLGQMRTGAASGVATRYMARADASQVGIIGSGKQARTQVQAVCKVRTVNRVHVYSPNEERRRKFATEMSEICQTDVEPVERAETAVHNKDIVITATNSREPVVNGHWIAQGTHINAVGSNFLAKAELDVLTVRRCKSIVVDSKDQARLEAGDLAQALEEGGIHWADVHELGQVVVGRFVGRAHPQDVTLFKSLGIGLEDVAVAARVYAKAKAEGVGRELDW
jgi:ornithine cyclodeaminase/alanine dehydrogenase-like protein (mu-crystallin family)